MSILLVRLTILWLIAITAAQKDATEQRESIDRRDSGDPKHSGDHKYSKEKTCCGRGPKDHRHAVCCGKNEGLNRCFNKCYARTCENRKKHNRLCIHLCRENPCDCAKGFLRNHCGECVHQHLCDKPCSLRPIQCNGQNEKLVGCFDPLKARICRNARPSQDPSCPADSPFQLELDKKFDWSDDRSSKDMCILNVCDCVPGYSRNKCGICVKDTECDRPCRPALCFPCSDPNEIRYKRLRECEVRSCANLERANDCTKTERMFRNQCDCKDGYARDDCGRCVPELECHNQRPCQCTNPCKKNNEEWRCVNTCTEYTCSNAYVQKLCISDSCSYKCDCVEGLWRNKDGECVLKKKCTQEDIEVT